MNKLRLCPFCGEKGQKVSRDLTREELANCINPNCPFYGVVFSLDIWQSRPIEDALRARLSEAEAAFQFHPRAAKLMRKQKSFIVIAIDEPYFKDAYDTIRANEKNKGTWTDEDEHQYYLAIAQWQEG